MRKRLLVAVVVGGALAGLFPLAVQASSTSAAATPTCVVVTGPGGLNLQVGYAPNGPADCQRV
jgi:hypothetical protein